MEEIIYKPVKRRKVNYINNRQLHEHMKLYLTERKEAVATGKELPRISKYIGESINHIANNLAKKPNFANYTFLEDMKGDGIENCIMYLHNFNPEKSDNPFAYITTIIWRAFVRRIQKEGTHSYIKHKLMSTQSVLHDMGEMSYDEGGGAFGTIADTKSASIVSQYENRIARKKAEKTEKANVNGKQSTPDSGGPRGKDVEQVAA
jgi:hypothetical protein